MNFKSISKNRFKKRISNNFTSRYVLNANFFPFNGVSNKMMMALNMLSFSVELRILSKLNDNNIIMHQLYGIINSRSEIEILEKTL